jgi:hypothetical protein
MEATMHGRAMRRHEAGRHMRRRLKEDRNQHYNDLSCACWTNPKVIARFKEQPKRCSRPWCCGNPRRFDGQRTIQEIRSDPVPVMDDIRPSEG